MSASALGNAVVEAAPDCPVFSSGCCMIGGCCCCDGNVGGVEGGFCMPVWAKANPVPNTKIRAVLYRYFISSSPLLLHLLLHPALDTNTQVRERAWKKRRPLISWVGCPWVRQVWPSSSGNREMLVLLKTGRDAGRQLAEVKNKGG